jgi:crotonobetainyl-CoA:carnitine CoA-transferase CaiB-like acyl-CoA transferase
MTDMMADCLHGLKVVDLTRNLPGPFATRLLADLGAEIVKIEPENGDPGRAFGELFKALNHGKHCEKIDFRSAAGIETIKAHIKDADVMLDSFRPEVLLGMGLDAATLIQSSSWYLSLVTGLLMLLMKRLNLGRPKRVTISILWR